MKDVVFEFTYPHPPERVWRALTDPDELAQWLMKNDFEPVVGHKFTFRASPVRMLFVELWNGVTECEVLEVEPNRRISYTFHSPPNPKTVVTYTLEPADGGTTLHFRQTGFHGFRGWMMRRAMEGGWRKMAAGAFAESLKRMAASER